MTAEEQVKKLRAGLREALDLLSDGPGGPLRITAMKLIRELLDSTEQKGK